LLGTKKNFNTRCVTTVQPHIYGAVEVLPAWALFIDYLQSKPLPEVEIMSDQLSIV